ncbi:TonB family protein [Klebsiella sp. B345]|uniref:TonB family protein n=1 Tax=Klebsiella sp. B345 TaxID=2755398 RepID=UPI003DA837D4
MMKRKCALLLAAGILLSACSSQVKQNEPKLLHLVQPDYPYYAAANNIRGEVKIRFDVGADGKVEKLWILSSEPQHLFDDVVISAVAKWRFEPNKPCKNMTKTIRFKTQPSV